MFFVEAGINHFGKTKQANKILHFFLKSSFKNITFMIHNQSFYESQKREGLDFSLPLNFYLKAIKKCHKKKKKIGLSLCDEKTFLNLESLNFDFFKLLSISINNKNLINLLKKKKKPVYISTGFNASNIKISKCLKFFKNTKNLTILHTPMTYDLSKLNFKRIELLKKKFKLPVGYSNHNDNFNTLNILSAYEPNCIFLYCKPSVLRGTIYPDDRHALHLHDLEKVKKLYEQYKTVNIEKIKKYKINIFKNASKKK